MQPQPAIELATFDISPERGFLPPSEPLDRLPALFAQWDEIARDLPKLLVADQARRQLDALPPLPLAALLTEPELNRAMLLLSYFGHAYVWGSAVPSPRIPAGIAVPWHQAAGRLGHPPVLSYSSYALHNWRRLDLRAPIALGNIALLQNFLAGVDEEWFILVHVEIEAKAAPALRAILRAQAAVVVDDANGLTAALQTMADAVRQMHATLLRMPERCDPYIYFTRVRPYIHGWKDQPALPDGLVYEGVEDYAGQPQKFRGETGAQSSIVPALDAALGISHQNDPLRAYLAEMRAYMPPRHRAFIAAIEAGPAVREYILHCSAQHPALRSAYNECVHWLQEFRGKHLEYAGSYIHRQAQRDAANPTQVGTGGTPFMPYLKKHLEETSAHLIA